MSRNIDANSQPPQLDNERSNPGQEAPPVLDSEEYSQTNGPEFAGRRRFSIFGAKKTARRPEPHATPEKDDANRKFLIAAGLLLFAIIALSVLIIDQLAFDGVMKKSAFSLFIPGEKENGENGNITVEPAAPAPEPPIDSPEIQPLDVKPEPHDTKPSPEVPIASGPPVPPGPNAATISEEDLADEDKAEKERIEEERRLQDEMAAAKIKEEAEARLLAAEKSRQDKEIAGQLAKGLLEIPDCIPLRTPRLSPFGAIEESQIEGQKFAEFAPLHPVQNVTEIKFVPFFDDGVWKHELVRDAATSLSRGWTLIATNADQKLVLLRLSLNDDGLNVDWQKSVREKENLKACDKLAFARLEFRIDFLGKTHEKTVRLFPPEKGGEIEFKSTMNTANSPKASVANVFSLPQWANAFSDMEIAPLLSIDVSVRPENPDGIEVISGGDKSGKYVDLTVRETPESKPVTITVRVSMDKDSITFIDTTYDKIALLNKERSTVRKAIKGKSDTAETPEEIAALEKRVDEIDAETKAINSARAFAKKADLRIKYAVWLEAKDYDKIENPNARLLILDCE